MLGQGQADSGLRRTVSLSVSMVGRILTDLQRRRVLMEPKATRLRPHARHGRPYAVRKPREYTTAAPGDLVQLDTMHLTPLPGVERRHFSAVDVVSRWSVTGVRGRATAGTATDFLDELQDRMPVPVRAIQVDGGSEFMAEFETACQERGLALFVLRPAPPSSMAMWSAPTAPIAPSSGALRRRSGAAAAPAGAAGVEETYNHSRPHQALGPHPRRVPRRAPPAPLVATYRTSTI